MTKPVLVYDDRCGPCTAFASGGRQGSRAVVLGYNTQEAQRLMEAQFGERYGFTLMLFKDPEVYWGNKAAREYVKLGYSSLLKTFAEWLYPSIVSGLNVILRRKRLPEPPHIEGEKARQGGSQLLSQRAREELERISGG